MNPAPINHGTYGGSQQHAKRNIPMCEPCRVARNTYHNRHRRRKNDWLEFSYADIRQFVTGSRK